MNSKSVLGLIFFVLFVVNACKTKEQVAENSSSPTGKTQGQANGDSTASNTAKTLTPDQKRVANKESWLGSEIVDESVYRLKSKLSTKKATNAELKKILTDSFLSIDGNLSATYPSSEAKAMGKKIIINSKDQIIEALETDTQKTSFKNLFLR